MKQLTVAEMVKVINETLPEALAVDRKEFDSNSNAGIWLRGSEDLTSKGEFIFDYWGESNPWGTPEVHPLIEELCNLCGWYWEPADAGTLMLYPA